MEVNDYAEPDSRSPLIDWLVGLGIPFVCLLICLALRLLPDWIDQIKARLA